MARYPVDRDKAVTQTRTGHDIKAFRRQCRQWSIKGHKVDPTPGNLALFNAFLQHQHNAACRASAEPGMRFLVDTGPQLALESFRDLVAGINADYGLEIKLNKTDADWLRDDLWFVRGQWVEQKSRITVSSVRSAIAALARAIDTVSSFAITAEPGSYETAAIEGSRLVADATYEAGSASDTDPAQEQLNAAARALLPVHTACDDALLSLAEGQTGAGRIALNPYDTYLDFMIALADRFGIPITMSQSTSKKDDRSRPSAFPALAFTFERFLHDPMRAKTFVNLKQRHRRFRKRRPGPATKSD